MWKLITLININIIVVCIFILILYYIKNIIRRRDAFDRFVEVMSIFEKAKDISYRKMFRDHVMVHSSSGYRINKEEIETFQHMYVKYVYRACGPQVIDDIKLIHGDLDSICLQLVNEFIYRIEQDEYNIISKISETEDEKNNEIMNSNE